MKKFPFYKQEGIKDCALASILMILKYYGGYINYFKLSELLKVNKQGVSAYHIVKTLEYLGFKSKGIKGCLNDLCEFPVIAHVLINRVYKHFIVIYECDFKRNLITIADPASGIKKIKIDDFIKISSGIFITATPVRVIKEKNENLFIFLIKQLIPFKKNIIILGNLFFAAAILSILLSFSFKFVIDRNFNIKIIIILICIIGLKLMLDYLKNDLLLKLNIKLDYCLSMSALKKIINLPYSYYHDKTVGEIVSRINDLQNVKNLFNQMSVIFFSDLPLIFISAALLFCLNKFLFILNLFSVLLILIIVFNFDKLKSKIEYVKIKDAESKSLITETIAGFKTIKGLCAEEKFYNLNKKKYKCFCKSFFDFGRMINNYYFFIDFILNSSTLLTLMIGLYFVETKVIELSLFMTFMLLLTFFTSSFKKNLDFIIGFSDSLVSLKRIREMTNYKIKEKYFLSSDVKIDLDFFTYDDEKYILKDIDLNIGKNEKIMITGTSGSGKSTLLHLIMNFYEVTSGSVMTNKNISYVSQNEWLFTGSLKDNLTIYHDEDLSEIINVCELLDFTNENGFDLSIEENGFNLSDGQKQRIVLARVLMKKFDILLIDEGLSKIDISMERRILKKLFLKYKSKTIVVVSHRLDNLDLFDRFIKVEAGKIIFDKTRNVGE